MIKYHNLGKWIKYCGIGVVAGIANGLFGSGGGTIAVPAMVLMLHEEDRTAHATALMIILPLTIVSACFYINSNFIDWRITLKAMIGGVVGGAIGALLLHKCPVRFIRIIFGVLMIIASFRMIF